jgi:hypothetical protein
MFHGFKTRFQTLVPVLDEKYVGNMIVETVINR